MALQWILRLEASRAPFLSLHSRELVATRSKLHSGSEQAMWELNNWCLHLGSLRGKTQMKSSRPWSAGWWASQHRDRSEGQHRTCCHASHCSSAQGSTHSGAPPTQVLHPSKILPPHQVLNLIRCSAHMRCSSRTGAPSTQVLHQHQMLHPQQVLLLPWVLSLRSALPSEFST